MCQKLCSDGFVVSHHSSVDDIVLGYIVSVLEQLGEAEQFDVDEFAEIMAAYIPGFDTVNKYVTVYSVHTCTVHILIPVLLSHLAESVLLWHGCL